MTNIEKKLIIFGILIFTFLMLYSVLTSGQTCPPDDKCYTGSGQSGTSITQACNQAGQSALLLCKSRGKKDCEEYCKSMQGCKFKSFKCPVKHDGCTVTEVGVTVNPSGQISFYCHKECCGKCECGRKSQATAGVLYQSSTTPNYYQSYLKNFYQNYNRYPYQQPRYQQPTQTGSALY